MALFYQPLISEGSYFLDPEESRHCIKVLRFSTGDRIRVLDGKGGIYECKITRPNPKQCAFEVITTQQREKPPFHIHIAIAPTKNLDRMEWFIEKAVEIGIQEVSFILCQNSERRVLKPERLEKKAVSAMKQSQNAFLPTIHAMESYSSVLDSINEDLRYIAHVDFDNPVMLSKTAPAGKNYCVLIGPEGDFTNDELALAAKKGFQKVSLGNSRLRTETAGIVACHILNIVNE